MGKKYDVLIVGGGPAGISAALTVCSRGKSAGVIGNPPDTSKLYLAEKIDNYPGLSGTGAELMNAMRTQLENSSADIIEGKALTVMPLGVTIGVAVGSDFFEAQAVIIASGIGRKALCEGESKFLGRGVSYCATCDGMLYRGKTVAVIGDSEEAKHDIEFLKSIGCEVLEFGGKEKIDILGEDRAETLVVKGVEYKTDCIFILKDSIMSDSLVPGIENDKGIIKCDRDGKTNIDGVFAAGDCTGAPYQLAKAVGEGNVAALSACRYIDNKTKEKK